MNLDCPQQEKLVAFTRGELTLANADTVSIHLDACAACEATVAKLESLHDTAIIALRHGGETSSFADEPEFLAARDAAARLGAAGDNMPQSVLEEDSLEELPLCKPSPQIGQIGPYQLLERLGQGGMGTVYKAFHEKLQRIVAVKVLRAEKLRDPDAIARFEREMAAVGRLAPHPNLVQAFDAGEFDGKHYLAMEYVDGVDLSRLVKDRGPLSIADACEFVRQTAIGLDHAHRHGMVHRDIKPSNLMLCTSAERDGLSASDSAWQGRSCTESFFETPLVKILDLGLARLRAVTGDGELTQESQVMGTLDYMAPEQAVSSKHVDIRADVFSLGATLCKLLTGQSIHHGEHSESGLAKLSALARWSPSSIRQIRKDVPTALDNILQQMLARDPNERISTPAEVALALAPFARAARSSGLPELAAAKRPPARPWFRNFSAWMKVACTCAVAAFLLVAVSATFIVYIKTGEGTLQIKSHDKDVKIIASRNGQEVAIVDLKTRSSVALPAGRYEVQMSEDKDGLRLSTDNFTLYRGQQKMVEVRRLTAAGPPAETAHSSPGKSSDAPQTTLADALYSDSFERPDRTRQFFDVRRATVEIADGRLVLRDRGCIVTKQMFPSGASLRLRWKWTEGDPKVFPDILSIVLRTKGVPDERWPFEISDGIHINFTPHGGGGVAIIDKANEKILTNKQVQQMDKDQWHDVKVVDWGDRIEVYFRDMQTPCLIAQLPDRSSHHHVAIYNREFVGAVLKESFIDDLVLAVPSAP